MDFGMAIAARLAPLQSAFPLLAKVCKPIAFRLCPRPIVTSPVTDAYVLVVSYAHLNFSEFTIGGHISRLVRHQVLLAQFPFELLEGLIDRKSTRLNSS